MLSQHEAIHPNLLSLYVGRWGPVVSPLHLHATKVYINSVKFNPNFVPHMMLKVGWAGLMELANKVPKGWSKGLRKMHLILQEVDVLEGTLQCPGSWHVSPSAVGSPTCCWVMRKLSLNHGRYHFFILRPHISLFMQILFAGSVLCISNPSHNDTPNTFSRARREYIFFSH